MTYHVDGQQLDEHTALLHLRDRLRVQLTPIPQARNAAWLTAFLRQLLAILDRHRDHRIRFDWSRVEIMRTTTPNRLRFEYYDPGEQHVVKLNIIVKG